MKTIGEKIRESRARKNLTQAELAEKSGLTIRTVSKYETETVVPRGRNLYKLAEVLGVSEAYLSALMWRTPPMDWMRHLISTPCA